MRDVKRVNWVRVWLVLPANTLVWEGMESRHVSRVGDMLRVTHQF